MRLRYPYTVKYSPGFGNIPTIAFWLYTQTPTGHLPFLFLFDTGADVTSLPASAAQKLGIDLDQCPQEPMSGFEGSTILVFRSQIQLIFNNHTFEIPCVFNPNEEVPLLLGRAGILDRFKIILDGKKKEVVFGEL